LQFKENVVILLQRFTTAAAASLRMRGLDKTVRVASMTAQEFERQI